MFTVLNRDVRRLVSIAVLCFFLSPRFLSAQSSDIISTGSTEYYTATVAVRDSYENYQKQRRVPAHRTSGPQKKQSHNKNIKKTQAAMTADVKKKNPKKSDRSKAYTVRTGDTLTNIARRNSTTVDALMSCNNFKNKNAIKIGMAIKIPARCAPPAAPHTRTAQSPAAAKPDGSPQFQWPVNSVISYHNDGLDGVKSIGIIITGKKGSPVVSSAPGTIKKIGSMRGFGKYVVIAHKGRYSTVYANLDRINVSCGDRVGAGNSIGRINASDQKLHFQIDLEGKPENPLKYLPGNI